MNSAANLISTSIRENRITRADYREDLYDVLLSECEDSTENELEYEFWGVDQDGDAWRVHLVRPAREAV